MVIMQNFISSQYSKNHFVFCLNNKFNNDDFVLFIGIMEEALDLKLMADGKSDVLNGFMTMSKPSGYFCLWGNHVFKGDHTSIILSLYSKDKPKEEGNTHKYEAVKLTDDLLLSIKKLHGKHII